MADKVDFDEIKYKRQRDLLLDYLEHASNKIAKKVTEVAIPERSNRNKEDDTKPAPKKAVVSDSPFTMDVSGEQEPVVIEAPLEAPKIIINPSEVDKLLYLRQKRGLLESVLLQDDKDKLEKLEPPKKAIPEMKSEIKPEVKLPAKTEIVQPVAAIASKVVKMPELKKTELKKIEPVRVKHGWKISMQKFLHRKHVRRIGRKVRHFAYGCATFAFGFYLAYLLLVYSFAPSNTFFGQLAGRLPAPAVISSYGLVDFYSYEQIKIAAKNDDQNRGSAYQTLKMQIIESLAKQYGVDADLDQDLLLEVLKRKVVSDSSLNYYGSRKYIELKQAQRRGDDLATMSETTGLTLHRASYPKRIAAGKFGDIVYGLTVNSPSPVIVNEKGIYVINPIAISDAKIDFDYIFVPARTIDQLVEEKIADAWMVSLVD